MYDEAMFPTQRSRFELGRMSRDVPSDIQARLTRAGGRNLYDEPNFRIIWGGTPTEYIYNLREGCYELRPRYMQKARDRWVVEKFHGPEHYGTPRMWRLQFTQNVNGREIDLLGPFPSRGSYEQLCTMQTPEGEYMELTSTVCDKLIDLVRASRDLSPWARREAVREQIENPDPGFDSYADDVIKEAQPVFDLRPTVWLGHKNVLKGKYETTRPSSKGVSK